MSGIWEIFERYSPAAWLDSGVTTRDDIASVRPRWHAGGAGVVRRGIVGVAAAALVSAGVLIGGQESPTTATPIDAFLSPGNIAGGAQVSEVPEGYWPRMIERVRTAKMLNEDALMDFESLI